jgi:hypothetical protein
VEVGYGGGGYVGQEECGAGGGGVEADSDCVGVLFYAGDYGGPGVAGAAGGWREVEADGGGWEGDVDRPGSWFGQVDGASVQQVDGRAGGGASVEV